MKRINELLFENKKLDILKYLGILYQAKVACGQLF